MAAITETLEQKGVLYAGIDLGSTTLKIIVLNSAHEVLYKIYKKHQANINKVLVDELSAIGQQFPDTDFTVNVTGSAGMGIAERADIPFIQEVVASIKVAKRKYSDVGTLMDLGGEDAKIVFFGDATKPPDIRMNGSCAGGTGAFIDQMSDLMHITVDELGQQALRYKKIYPVASRCGVFAKTDVQNLISRNVPAPDVAMSILHTVALQTVTSLARGVDIKPKIICTGGPLTFLPALRNAFCKVLSIEDGDLILPENSEYFPAWGAALVGAEALADEMSAFADTEALADEMSAFADTEALADEMSAFAGAEALADEMSAFADTEALADEGVQKTQNIHQLIQKLEITNCQQQKEALPALFSDETEYRKWQRNRKIKPLKKIELSQEQTLNCFLGIDSGSTTTKIMIIDDAANVIYNYYAGNEGNPLKKVIEGLSLFYGQAKNFRFVASAVTGYGEDLVKSALNLDYGIVETMAHLLGAQYADPEVSFVLDIGGQDMKSIFTHNGVISNIELNEACSSGCGSFLQNFASTMDLSLDEFTRSACLAKSPSDLGTRCTVFMNSKVKQSLRENAALGDIAAGLAYSVVKNCLFKVLKISNLNLLGEHIVVQGGTFRNDAVYRALEILSGKTVSSTDCPEMMGAFGAALYARKMMTADGTKFTGVEVLPDVDNIPTKEFQCKGCTNQCSVLQFKFENGNVSYAGNKCEKVFYNRANAVKKGYNAFEMKNEVLFGMDVAGTAEKRDNSVFETLRIGIPRVLNMYENYPFWRTLFTECGFETVLSPQSTYTLYHKGIGGVMSDNICFPAKLVHGHILALMEQSIDRIFYPMIIKEEKEAEHSCNSFNCPIVSGYPDVVRSSMDIDVPLDKPVITFHDNKALEKSCYAYLSSLGVTKNTFTKAFSKAVEAYNCVKKHLCLTQKEILDKTEGLVFVVAGRPYHSDPLIHQKVGQILSDLGVTVLTDDVFRYEGSSGFRNLNIVSQWSYPNRVVHAAMEVAKLSSNVQLVQLNSFGCGPDAFFMNEVENVLKRAGKSHTVLKIDEIAAPGSVRLRLRSLVEALCAQTNGTAVGAETGEKAQNTAVGAETGAGTRDTAVGKSTHYTKSDRQKTILVPWFADFLSPFVPAIGELAGYKIVNIPPTDKYSAEVGLKYGNNEVCYPATLVLGDIITALQSGDYDLNDVVVAISQTGGQCRATNYISLIKSGMKAAGFSNIPIVAIGSVHQNEQKDFKLPILKIANITVYSLLYADALWQMYNSSIVREVRKGNTQELFDFYIQLGVRAAKNNDHKTLLLLLEQAVADFNILPIHGMELTKIGLIGEIYVKYNNYGQAHITEWLQSNNMEVITPPILDFWLQYFVNYQVNIDNGRDRKNILQHYFNPLLRKYLNAKICAVDKIMQNYRFYHAQKSVYEKAHYASEILDLSNQFGEGWLIAAETACYARRGIDRIVCIQPFGCIANHIVAKGIEKRLKQFYPSVNILYLDIDGGMAEVNLHNRLHFLMEQSV
ncbi:MAG: acyl-CoA dehydratase activase-related protein [Bacteroidales bacterium]|jgi:predicted CoA-substrate-specific enzyme activase|nr:acyl-CoA dehydratase activase-related protein [Bacteroidales bacterium]